VPEHLTLGNPSGATGLPSTPPSPTTIILFARHRHTLALLYVRSMPSRLFNPAALHGFLLGDRDFNNLDELILRDHLALVRTRLANERTLLSYIRSALYLLIGGIALLGLEGYTELRWLGNLSLGLCVLFVVVGVYRYHTLRRQLDRYYLVHTVPPKPAQPGAMPGA
jgi:putative membrane protein